jgi:mRNA-degrading endonuclease toxin of MazEF toxin-antitoxin module
MIQDGQVVLIRFPQADHNAGKLRPALVVRRLPGRHDDWLISLISSNISQQIADFDELIRETDDDFATSGLKVASLIRIGRLATVDQRLFIGSIGRLSDGRVQEIKSRLSRWISESPRSKRA